MNVFNQVQCWWYTYEWLCVPVMCVDGCCELLIVNCLTEVMLFKEYYERGKKTHCQNKETEVDIKKLLDTKLKLIKKRTP